MPILYEKGNYPTMTGGTSAGAGGKAGGSTNAGAGTASGSASVGVKLGGRVNAGPKPTKKAPKSKNTSNNNSPARQDAMTRRANSGGYSGGGGNSGGGGGNRNKPPKPATPAKPAQLPTFDEWAMKDSAYQQALADYNLRLSNAQNKHDTLISAANQDQTNQIGDWQTQFERGQQGLLDDFAARGLGNSGLYADAQQKYVSDSEAQKQAIMDAILRRIQGADSELAGNKTAEEQALQQAKLAAAQRGAGKYSGTV